MLAEQLALDLDPDAWISDALNDLLVPSEPVEPDSPAKRAEIAVRIEEHDRVALAKRGRALMRPRYVPPPYKPLTLPPSDWWVKLQRKLGNDVSLADGRVTKNP